MRKIFTLVLLTFLVSQTAFAQRWLWAKEITTSTSSAVKMAVDKSGNIYTLASFSGQLIVGTQTLTATGTGDLYLAKYRSSGEFLYARQIKVSSTIAGLYDLAIDAEGDAIIVGSYTGTLTMDYEVPQSPEAAVTTRRSFVAKLRSTTGLARWVKYSAVSPTYPSSRMDEYTAVATDKTGGIYIGYRKYRSENILLAAYYQLNQDGTITGETASSPPL